MAVESIYVSYSWAAENEKQVVDKLEEACRKRNIKLKRDRNEINYAASIREYMDQLAAGDAIILVLSEAYFKSQSCMYELREIYNDKRNFRKRVFPIVLSGAKFHKPRDRIQYLKFWEEEAASLQAELTTLTDLKYTKSIFAELDNYGEFRRLTDELLNILADMNTLTEDIHVDSDFEKLLERIKPNSTIANVTVVQQEPTKNLSNVIVDTFTRPAWASNFGEDSYGHYADLTVKDVIQRFRWIKPGTFMMGSPASELEREWNGHEEGKGSETLHQVTLNQGLWLADTACTQAFWQAVVGNNPSYFKDNPNNPVEQVSWEDVREFIQILNVLIPGVQARLPTEAQWEYACRAGTTTPFSFGANITPEQVNYNGKHPYAGAKKGLYREKTVPVKSLPANPWGLYEMHGNIWEWCHDWYGAYAVEAITDPNGSLDGSFRVLRGGSWFSNAGFARSANRYLYTPDSRSNNFGFRLALG